MSERRDDDGRIISLLENIAYMLDRRPDPIDPVTVGGGSAFPAISDGRDYGMLLRDYFAAAALNGMLASETERDSSTLDAYANDAYRFADAMLAERAK